VQRRAEEIKALKDEEAKIAKPYGELNRITIPHVFKHDNGS